MPTQDALDLLPGLPWDALSLDVGCAGMLSHLAWGVPGAWMGAALVVAVSGAGRVYVGV